MPLPRFPLTRRARWTPVLLALLLSGCVFPFGRSTRGASSSFTGTWSGTGVQSDQPGEWSIVVTLPPGPSGAIRGTIMYPSLACGGVLVHEREIRGQLVAKERLEFGQCLEGGTVVLATHADGGLMYHWYSKGGGVTAGGRLYRMTR